jgi:ornithine carbamoyltransferase
VKQLLSLAGLSRADIEEMLALAEAAPAPLLAGKGAALYFEKPSARTRNSMELAVHQLGGHPVYLTAGELGIGTRESVEDIARTLACYHGVICARVFDHGLLCRWSTCCRAPTTRCRASPTSLPFASYAAGS